MIFNNPIALLLRIRKLLFNILKSLFSSLYVILINHAGMLEEGRQGGRTPPQVLADQKAPP